MDLGTPGQRKFRKLVYTLMVLPMFLRRLLTPSCVMPLVLEGNIKVQRRALTLDLTGGMGTLCYLKTRYFCILRVQKK